jgi:hypothetical protein
MTMSAEVIEGEIQEYERKASQMIEWLENYQPFVTVTVTRDSVRLSEGTFSWFRCPHCQTRSTEMMPTDKVHEVTEAEWRQEPQMASICGEEILVCPCRAELTWFEMEKITELWVVK